MPKYTLPPDVDPEAYVVGNVILDPQDGLEPTARKLEQALGISMRATDRYDEIPAYVGQSADLEFALLGIAPDSPWYPKNPRTAFHLDVSSVATKLTNNVQIDVSEQLRDYLAEGHAINCWLSEPLSVLDEADVMGPEFPNGWIAFSHDCHWIADKNFLKAICEAVIAELPESEKEARADLRSAIEDQALSFEALWSEKPPIAGLLLDLVHRVAERLARGEGTDDPKLRSAAGELAELFRSGRVQQTVFPEHAHFTRLPPIPDDTPKP